MPTVSVLFNNQEFKFECQEEDTLYNLCEKNGLKLPHGCLAGSCGSCKCEVIEGLDKLKKASVIESDTIASIKKNNPQVANLNIRLSCRAKVLGDVTIKPLKIE